MNERILIEKLMKIEALFAGAATKGERISADLARRRILARLEQLVPNDPPVEYRFTFGDMWSRKVFVALLRRYDLRPYRYHRQRYTTVMVKVPRSFVDETLWPEFNRINSELREYLRDVTEKVVREVLHEDSSEAEVVEEPLGIAMNSGSEVEREVNPEDKDRDISPGNRKGRRGKGRRNKRRRKKMRKR